MLPVLYLCAFSMHYYLHIPFCRQKCPYCKFALTPVFDDVKKRRYIAHLKKEIREFFSKSPRIEESKSPDTIYFGWWTPSVLSLEEVREILDCFPFEKEKHCEISFECNPEDITQEYIEWLFSLGINRLSLGVQSLNNQTLKAIHRSDHDSIFRALDCIHLAINKPAHEQISINIDLILWLPHSKPRETLANIHELHKHFPFITHTSVYMLEDELYPKDWKKHSLNEKQIQEEFLTIMDFFKEKWWHHYELSNFSKTWYECAHNRAYWDHSEYRGFWLSASSFLWGKRVSNASSFSGYFAGKREEETLAKEDIEIERIMFWLRTDGCDIGNPQIDAQKLKNLLEDKLLMMQGWKILPTKTWIFLLDYIMGELIAEN